MVKYSYLADGGKASALKGNGEGLVYRSSLIYRRASDGTLSLESAAFAEGMLTPAGVRYHVTDHLGSVRAVVDGESGAFLEAGKYDAYGSREEQMTEGSSDATLRWHFTGKEDQSPDFGTAYTDFGARQYSPSLRRWLVPDPLSEKYYDVSPYVYCNDNPVNMVDVDGREMTDFFNKYGVFIYSDNIDNGIIRITSEEIIETAQMLYPSDEEVSSFLNDNSVLLRNAYSQGIIDDNSALSIYNHYNNTGLTMILNDSISGNFSFNTDLTISANIKKSLTPDEQGFTMSNYFDIKSAINVHEGEGHYRLYKELGLSKYGSIPANEREVIAIETQMKDSSWKKTTEKFREGVKKYYQINKKKNE